MRCFTDEDGHEECYGEREVREAEALGWFLVIAAVLLLMILGSVGFSQLVIAWEAVPRPIGPAEIKDFLGTILGGLVFGIVLFVLGMGMAIQVFGAFRGPGSTPGPVMRDMSRGDYDPPWGDAPM